MDGKEYLRSQLIIDAVRFQYVVPHPASTLDKASPFQLISPGVAETAGAFRLIAELPQGASELVNDGQDIAAMRIAGQGYSVLPIQLSSLKMVLDHLQSEIVVVLSMNEAIAAAAAEIIKTATYPILHVRRAQEVSIGGPS